MIDDHWSAAEDAALIDAVGRGLPMGQIADEIGRTRNACISRYNRKLVSTPKKWFDPPENFAEFAPVETNVELQVRYQASPERITHWRKVTGITSPATRSRVPDDFASMCRQHTKASLARHYGVAPDTINRWLRVTGLTALKMPPNRHHSGQIVIAIDSRDGSLATRAQSHLQRFVSVWRCDERGHVDPKGAWYQVGRVVVTPAEMIARAERKGFDAAEWTRLAA